MITEGRAENLSVTWQNLTDDCAFVNRDLPEGIWGGLVSVQISVLHGREGVTDANADAVISGNKFDFVEYLADGEYSPERLERIADISGDAGVVSRFLKMLESSAPNFNVILP